MDRGGPKRGQDVIGSAVRFQTFQRLVVRFEGDAVLLYLLCHLARAYLVIEHVF